MPQDQLVVRGAREHNLKDVTVAFPRDRLVVITGLSGSGKSSLAFDTIYAEGQRRYVESLSAYARQFLGQMEKPDVDQIDGLSPAISIDQKGASRNPRSTVGTVTEIYDYLRLLFARAGHPHCPNGHPIERQTVQQIVDQVLALPEGTRLLVLGPLIKDRKTEGDRVFDGRPAAGLRPRPGRRRDVRPRRGADARQVQAPQHRGRRRPLHRPPRRRARGRRAGAGRPADRPGDRRQPMPDPDAVAARRLDRDRAAARRGRRPDRAGAARRRGRPAFEERRYSERFTCPYDGFTMDELEPRNFSFNSPHGACPACTGLGTRLEIDPDLVIPDKTKSLQQGALVPWAKMPNDASWRLKILEAICQSHGWDFKKPIKDLPPEALEYILRAQKDEKVLVRYRHERGENTYKATFEGIITNLERRYRETDSEYIKTELEKYMVTRPCPTCGGKRLKPEVLAVTVDDRNISDVATLSITDALDWVAGAAEAPDRARADDRATRSSRRSRARLGFLVDVGLDYLTLDRASITLSGGEAQRIRLATQIGTTLMGVLYILDEPSIGLHQRDNAKLIATLTRLRDLGNTVLVVEHDEETIRTADWVIDIGPGAGEHGGEIIANGPLEDRPRRAALDHRRVPPRRADRCRCPTKRRKGNLKKLVVKGAREHNLRGRRLHGAARDVHRDHRRVGQRQVDARHRRPLPGPRPRAERLAGARRGPRLAQGRRAHRQDHRDRPEPDRPDAALEPGDLHRAVRADPRAVRRRPRGARPRLPARPLQLQRQGRPLRELQGRRDPEDRDAVPAGRLRDLRGLQGQALQPRGARDPLQGPLDRRRPRDDDRRGDRLLRGRPERSRRSSRPCTTSASATSTSASRRRRCPAARRSGSSSRPSCRGGRPAGPCTSSTSRRPGSTSPTSRSCSRSSTGSSTAATRSS